MACVSPTAPSVNKARMPTLKNEDLTGEDSDMLAGTRPAGQKFPMLEKQVNLG